MDGNKAVREIFKQHHKPIEKQETSHKAYNSYYRDFRQDEYEQYNIKPNTFKWFVRLSVWLSMTLLCFAIGLFLTFIVLFVIS